jgi:hypothetical protein
MGRGLLRTCTRGSRVMGYQIGISSSSQVITGRTATTQEHQHQ